MAKAGRVPGKRSIQPGPGLGWGAQLWWGGQETAAGKSQAVGFYLPEKRPCNLGAGQQAIEFFFPSTVHSSTCFLIVFYFYLLLLMNLDLLSPSYLHIQFAKLFLSVLFYFLLSFVLSSLL